MVMESIHHEFTGCNNNKDIMEQELYELALPLGPEPTGNALSDVEGDEVVLMKDTDFALEYESRPNISCRQNFADCSNVFKAFIGVAMVGLPFATLQAGVGFALIGILIISVLTDHCCSLIVKCKKMVITKIIKAKREKGVDEVLLREEEKSLGRDMSFGSVGKACLGTPGVVLINAALMITQLGCTIGYFIFLGNTMRSILKYFLVKNSNNTSAVVSPTSYNNDSMLHLNLTSGYNPILLSDQSILRYINEKLPVEAIAPQFLNSSVAFSLFLLLPLPLLILIAFIRNLRKLGPVSVIANAALTTAFGATSLYIIFSMKSLARPISWFKVTTFPILFGQVTFAFEGIGTVIPIESSMSENRAKYPVFLHITVMGVSLILSSFGIIGYLAFGDATCQIITGNLTGPIAVVLQILLFIGILFTYPLQIYPCIEITELIILKIRHWRANKTVTYKEMQNESDDEEGDQLIFDIRESAPMNRKLKSWESNIVRASLVIMTAIIALVFRFQFVYISALAGSFGSTFLLYIIPALCQIQLSKGNKWLKIKNILLVIFGIIGTVCGVSITIKELIDSFNGSLPAHC